MHGSNWALALLKTFGSLLRQNKSEGEKKYEKNPVKILNRREWRWFSGYLGPLPRLRSGGLGPIEEMIWQHGSPGAFACSGRNCRSDISRGRWSRRNSLEGTPALPQCGPANAGYFGRDRREGRTIVGPTYNNGTPL